MMHRMELLAAAAAVVLALAALAPPATAAVSWAVTTSPPSPPCSSYAAMAMTPTTSGMAAVASCSTGAFVYECPASAGACTGTALWAASPAPSPAPATDLLLASWDSTSSKVVVIGSFRDFSPSPPLQTVKASTIALAPSPPGPTWTQNTGTVSQISGSFDPSWWSNPRSIKASNGKMYAAGSTALASTKTASLARCEADGTSCAIIDVYAVASRAARGKTATRVGLVDDVTNSQILVVALDDESSAREVELFSVSYDLATATFLGSLRPAGVTHTEFSEVTPIIDTGNSTLYVMVSGASDLYVYRTTLTGTVIGVDDAVAKVSPAPSPAIRVDSARGQVVNGKLVMVTVDDTTNKPGVFVCELDVSSCTYDAYTGSETVSSSARKTEVVFDVASLTIHAFAAAGSGPALHRYAITGAIPPPPPSPPPPSPPPPPPPSPTPSPQPTTAGALLSPSEDDVTVTAVASAAGGVVFLMLIGVVAFVVVRFTRSKGKVVSDPDEEQADDGELQPSNADEPANDNVASDPGSPE